jgi:hypothetical protein
MPCKATLKAFAKFLTIRAQNRKPIVIDNTTLNYKVFLIKPNTNQSIKMIARLP